MFLLLMHQVFCLLVYNTPLHFAARNSNFLISKVLIAAGAKLGFENSSKETPYQTVKMSNNQKLKKYFNDICCKKVERTTVDQMIAKFMPILDGEEEEEEFEEEEEEDQNEKSEIIIHQTPDNSNENDMNKIVLQNEQKVKQVKNELSQIENQIKFVKNKLNLPDLNSTDLQEGDVIETPIELKDDSTVSNINNQLKVLNDQINQIGNILNISPTDEKLSTDHQAKDEKNANQNDSTITKNDNEEPFQTNATNHIPIFFGKGKCLLCGTSNCHICNKCKKPYCFICSKTNAHEKTHQDIKNV